MQHENLLKKIDELEDDKKLLIKLIDNQHKMLMKSYAANELLEEENVNKENLEQSLYGILFHLFNIADDKAVEDLSIDLMVHLSEILSLTSNALSGNHVFTENAEEIQEGQLIGEEILEAIESIKKQEGMENNVTYFKLSLSSINEF